MNDKDKALKLALVALKNSIAVRHGEGGTMLVYPLEDNAINAIKEALAQPPRPEQQQARVDVITVTLMREGINKHRARELADHFVNFTLPPPLPMQEFVGEVTHVSDNGFKCEFNQRLAVGAKLYTTPPAAQQAEPLEYWNAVEGWVKIDEVREHFEAVNCGTIYKHGGEGRVPLYTAPPQRPWVGLTEDEKFEMAAAQYGWEDLLIAAEAKLKQKNNG